MKKARIILTGSVLMVVLMILFSGQSVAKTIQVSITDSYSKIEEAQAGDEVVIAPGTYHFRLNLTNSGTHDKLIIIRAQDPDNRPVWDLDGKNVQDWPGSYRGGDHDRGAWQIKGDYYLISGIILRNATNGRNAAGMRFVGCDNIKVQDCLFQHNNNGITGKGDNIKIENSEFDSNGCARSSKMTHNIYLYGGSFELKFLYVHDAVCGQNLHSRARELLVENCWIANAKNYEGDIMAGAYNEQSITFKGNVIIQHDSPTNKSSLLTLFNDSGRRGSHFQINFFYNTIIGNGGSTTLVKVRNDTLDTASTTLFNNIIYGLGDVIVVRDPSKLNCSITGSNNWLSSLTETDGLGDSFLGLDPGFIGMSTENYTLRPGAVTINRADLKHTGVPVYEYHKDETISFRYRLRKNGNDLGAFESTTYIQR